MPQRKPQNPIANAILDTLISANEPDSNLEPANVVDGLYMIARGLHDVARAIRELAKTPPPAQPQPQHDSWESYLQDRQRQRQKEPPQ